MRIASSVLLCVAVLVAVQAVPATYCFGDNELGTAASATRDYVDSFRLPAGFPSSSQPFATACGGFDAIAAASVATKDGKNARVVAWGHNGPDKLLGRENAPKEYSTSPEGVDPVLIPQEHPTTDVTPIKICGGTRFLAMLTEEGDIYTLGSTSNGESGVLGQLDDPPIDQFTMLSVPGPGGVEGSPFYSYQDMDCGDSHTIALTLDGVVGVWGLNEFHQVATNENVDTDGAYGADGWSTIDTGGKGVSRVFASKYATYYLTDEADGYKLYGWGFGGFGILGGNNTEALEDDFGYQFTPQPVAGDQSWLDVSAGTEVAFMIERGSQDLYVMGRNSGGIAGMLPGTRNFPAPTKLILPAGLEAAEGWSDVQVLDDFVIAKTKKEEKWYIWGKTPYVDGGSGGFLYEPTEFLGLLNRLDTIDMLCPGRNTLCFVGDGPNVLLVLAVPIGAAVAVSAGVLCFVYSATKRALGPGSAPKPPPRNEPEDTSLLKAGAPMSAQGSKRRAGGAGGSKGSRKGSKGSKSRRSTGSKRKQ